MLASPITLLRSSPASLYQQNNFFPFLFRNQPLPLPLTIDFSSLVSGLPVIIMTRRDSETKCFFGCQCSRKNVVDFAQLVAVNLPRGTRVNRMSRQLSRASQFQDFTSGEAQMFCYTVRINVGFL